MEATVVFDLGTILSITTGVLFTENRKDKITMIVPDDNGNYDIEGIVNKVKGN